jgi:hypothetical protein
MPNVRRYSNKVVRLFATAAVCPLLVCAQVSWFSRSDHFAPKERLSGIGVSRLDMPKGVLESRTQSMIESQTFAIMRDPQALAGAKRITSPKMQAIFASAARSSGLPADFIASIAYLESWGNPTAVSPAGPKGIMQIAAGTARAMGLRMVYAKRYRSVTQKRRVRLKSGKTVTRNVRRRVPYSVLVRDERMVPAKAVPAAARYLARLEQKFGGRDWAVWAYHCGEGCTSQVLATVRESDDLKGDPPSVAQVFFGAHPGRNQALYQTLKYHMERDFSPTYWFRVTRARQLLAMYESDAKEFEKLWREYQNRVNPNERAPHRLSVWLTEADLAYKTCDDMKRAAGRELVEVFDKPKYFGFELRKAGALAIGADDPANQRYYFQASPAVVGTMAYIAFETRRVHDAMKRKGEKWVPLEVTSLVRPLDKEMMSATGTGDPLPAHCTGQVFDIDFRNLPSGQREALEFTLDELGWLGMLGFVKEAPGSTVLHIGAAPTARDFFTRIYYQALEEASDSD